MIQANNEVDQQYLSLFEEILEMGDWQDSRTGVRLKCLFGRQLCFDMRKGFAIPTSRFTPIKSAMKELEGFIKGITDKAWYQAGGCKFWDYWADPRINPYATDEETKKKLQAEMQLGEIYGAQWRNCHDPRVGQYTLGEGDPYNARIPSLGIDQLQILVDKIRKKEDDRRLIVSAWNPLALHAMALVPCHYSFTCHISPCKTYLDLKWNQRSCDLALGHNIHNYSMLLTLLANEGGLIPRYLIPSYENVHIYENQVDTVREQLTQETFKLPTIKLTDWKFETIFDWTSDCYTLEGYEHGGKLKYPLVAI